MVGSDKQHTRCSCRDRICRDIVQMCVIGLDLVSHGRPQGANPTIHDVGGTQQNIVGTPLVGVRCVFLERSPYLSSIKMYHACSWEPNDAYKQKNNRAKKLFHQFVTSSLCAVGMKRCTASHTSATVTACIQVQSTHGCILPRKKHGLPLGLRQRAICCGSSSG